MTVKQCMYGTRHTATGTLQTGQVMNRTFGSPPRMLGVDKPQYGNGKQSEDSCHTPYCLACCHFLYRDCRPPAQHFFQHVANSCFFKNKFKKIILFRQISCFTPVYYERRSGCYVNERIIGDMHKTGRITSEYQHYFIVLSHRFCHFPVTGII